MAVATRVAAVAAVGAVELVAVAGGTIVRAIVAESGTSSSRPLPSCFLVGASSLWPQLY